MIEFFGTTNCILLLSFLVILQAFLVWYYQRRGAKYKKENTELQVELLRYQMGVKTIRTTNYSPDSLTALVALLPKHDCLILPPPAITLYTTLEVAQTEVTVLRELLNIRGPFKPCMDKQAEEMTKEELKELYKLHLDGLYSLAETQDEELHRLIGELQKQSAEVARLQGLMTGDPKVISAQFDQAKGMICSIESWAVRLIAYSLMKTLDEHGAENYVTMEVTSPDDTGGNILVTVQRPGGISPWQKPKC